MYEAYAPIYDRIGQGAWSVRMAAWTLDWLAARGVTVRTVADFGCGTGEAAQVFRANGMKVVGIDGSKAMLERMEQRVAAGIEMLNCDLCEVELSAPVDLVVSFYDTLNYLLTFDDLRVAWRSIAGALSPHGYAVADVNTLAAYRSEWNGRIAIVADTAELFVLNQLQFEALRRIGTGRILWFEREMTGEGEDWIKGEETHRQRAHTDEELREAIEAAGLELVACHAPGDGTADEQATRLIYVAHKRDG